MGALFAMLVILFCLLSRPVDVRGAFHQLCRQKVCTRCLHQVQREAGLVVKDRLKRAILFHFVARDSFLGSTPCLQSLSR